MSPHTRSRPRGWTSDSDWDDLDEAPPTPRRRQAKARPPSRQPDTWPEGVVIRVRGHEYDVQLAEQQRRCTLAGRILQAASQDTLIAVGDRVQVQSTPRGKGVIQAILPRTRVLSRQRPFVAHPAEDVILSNPDQLMPVFAVQEPAPRLPLLDRYLVIAEAYELSVLICVTKMDLSDPATARATFGLYEDLGYPVVYTGLDHSTSLATLREACQGRISVLAGPSGVGKSTLLNRLDPRLNLKTGAVRTIQGKGSHTTRATRLLPLPDMADTYIADTPGIREFRLFGFAANELPHYFVDVARLHNNCQFAGCLHIHEPGCVVRQAAEQGTLHPARYESYRRLVQSLEDPWPR